MEGFLLGIIFFGETEDGFCVLILDEGNNKIIDANKEGELCVRGTSLAMGYYNNPEKTAAACPFRLALMAASFTSIAPSNPPSRCMHITSVTL